MFIILIYFCYTFYARALKPKEGQTEISTEARFRAFIYAACGLTIIGVIIAVLYDAQTGGSVVSMWNTFIFYAEATGLIAFGVAWFVSSRNLPLITAEFERYSLNPHLLQVDK